MEMKDSCHIKNWGITNSVRIIHGQNNWWRFLFNKIFYCLFKFFFFYLQQHKNLGFNDTKQHYKEFSSIIAMEIQAVGFVAITLSIADYRQTTGHII